ncbi:MAG: CDP-diacylglycerol--glycerol-3-phosphate 3-phosphatidyltransferase [Gammaproteobacteria bacterium]|nr:CDP-diacylglycerol--glycerol-3-phosphate 3-phosphatidyltransferase [Gammaproteobacteria bacterium]
MSLNLPNFLTLLRIFLMPILIFIFYLPYEWAHPVSALIFMLAGFTDWLDGYLARRLNQQSAFGAFLDPVADKLLVAVILILVLQENPTPWIALPAMVIIGREIVVSALREWMAELGHRNLIAVSMLGKIKTSAQMLALLFLLYHDDIGGFSMFYIGQILLYIAALLTVQSMFLYLKTVFNSQLLKEK